MRGLAICVEVDFRRIRIGGWEFAHSTASEHLCNPEGIPHVYGGTILVAAFTLSGPLSVDDRRRQMKTRVPEPMQRCSEHI